MKAFMSAFYFFVENLEINKFFVCDYYVNIYNISFVDC